MERTKTIIIAEAGVNHNGDYRRAVAMIHAAKEAGADYVKFQTAVPELVISTFAEKAEYQKETTGADESQLEMSRKIHLKLSDYPSLKQICDEVGIGFMSTPFDLVSIDCLASLGMDFWKIPSGEITNLPYLRKIGAMAGRVILSTGMSTIAEIKAAMDILVKAGTKRGDIALLHCNTQYPTPMRDVNLRAMLTMAQQCQPGMIGYSDHTLGIEVPIAAVAMGAQIIEKHFTLDKSLPGPDHRASLDTQQLTDMVRSIRNIEAALGSGEKLVSDSERPNIDIARKSIVATRAIRKGELLTEENLTVKRPGWGTSPMLWDSLIGRTASRDYLPDEPLMEL